VLQQRYAALSSGDQKRVEDLFAPHGTLNALFVDGEIKSGLADRYRLPVDLNTASPFKQSLKIKLMGQPRS